MASSVKYLTIKSCRMIWRSQSMRTLVFLSSLIVFGSLYLMWFMSYGQTLKFMTSNAYTKLSFDLICAPGLKYQPGISECKPTGDNRPDGALSPADLLINLLSTGNILSDSNDPNSAHDFAGLLSSIMMNGAPMLGLDDFVHLSDFVNKNLGSEGRNQIMNSPAYSDKFGNFLDVRKRELRITPYSCWTESFLYHLNKNSLIAKDLHVIQYPSMNDAMKDCCDNVWAIVEIIGPNEGFECSLFRESGGTQYQSPEPSLQEHSSGKPFEKIDKEQSLSSAHRSQYSKFETSYSEDNEKEERDSEGSRSQNGVLNNATSSHTNDEQAKIEDPVLNVVELRALMGLGPSITVRMLPSAVPDTRNFEWSPRKSGSIRQQSGQLLYFLSGFLSIQLEMQNFLSAVGLGGPLIRTQVLGESPEESFLRPHTITRNIAEALMKSTTNNEVYSAIINTTAQHREQRPSLLTPLYHRAFPTHRYVQQTYWHVYASMITTALVVYFSLPAAVTAGAFRREVAGGQLDSLSTLPGLRAVHSAAGWYLCGAAWSTISFLFCYTFFHFILEYTNAMVPALNLYLCGLSLGPLAIALGCVIKRADALVVTVPTFVFVTMLPGLLYVDLAFDVQRSVWVEVLMCLLPPSAAALVLREVCALEALNISADWNYPAPISRTPVYAYTLVLLFDCLLYCALAAVFIEMNNRTATPTISPPKMPPVMRQSLWGNSDDDVLQHDFYGTVRGVWKAFSSICNVIAGTVSQGMGYFWGCQSPPLPYNYSSLSQEQRACLDNYDVNFGNNNFGLRSLKKIPKRSTSVRDVRIPTPFGDLLTMESGSRSMDNITLLASDVSSNRSITESIDNQNTADKQVRVHHDNSITTESFVVPQGIGPAPGPDLGPRLGPRIIRGSSMDVKGGSGEGLGPQGDFLRPKKACIRITDLRKEYVTARTGVVVLEEVSAELKQGTVTCLLGSNGAGKTTLLRILCGLDSQYTGSITLTESNDDDDDEDGDVGGRGEDGGESKDVDVSSQHARRKDEDVGKGNGNGNGNGKGERGRERKGDREERKGDRDRGREEELKGAGNGVLQADVTPMQGRRSRNVTSLSTVMSGRVQVTGPRSASRRNRSQVPPLSLSFCPPSSSSSTSSSSSSPFTWGRDIAISVLSFWIVTFAKAKRLVTYAKKYMYPPKKARARRCVGWCAQEDALFEFLTVREHIELFDNLMGVYETVTHDTSHNTTASIDTISIKENEIYNSGIKNKYDNDSENDADIGTEESYGKEETYFSKKLNQLVLYLSYFLSFRPNAIIEKAQTLVLTRLGMVEHADKMACELSGNRMDL